MGLFFNSLHEQNTVLFVPPIKRGFHYMNYKIIEPKDAFISSINYPIQIQELNEVLFTPLKISHVRNGTPLAKQSVPLEIQGQQLPINKLNGTPPEGACPISNLHRYKERIKKLKIKEPVKKTNWIDYGDIFTDTKERIKELKLREPVQKTLFIDDDIYL